MAAKNPFRVSDLISKYGWKIMPYLSNLGPQLLAEAQVLFVDSGHVNATDADDTEHGHSFEKPLATIDYAIGLCTAGERSIILVAPGHNDPLGDEQIDFDVSDITIIGVGEGTNMPTINFDHANSSVDIGANNVHLTNLRFLPAITDVLVGVDIETGVTGTIIEDCVWAEGENAPDEFVLSVDVKAGCNNTKITNCKFRTKVAAAGCTNGIQLNDASDNVIIEKCRLLGNYSNAAINGITGASTDVLIDDVTIKTADSATGIKMYTGTTGIIRNACLEVTGTAINSMIVADAMAWFNNFGVTTDGTAAEIVGGGEVLAALATAITSTPTEKSLNDILHKDGSFTYDNTSDSLEAIADAVGAISSPTDVTGAVPNTPTLKSLQDILSKAPGSNNYSAATDSLEAIADAILTGTNILAGVNLDHLMKTAVVDEQNMSAEIATGSALAHILVKAASGNVTDFDPTTDSLQAIADAVTGFTTAVSQNPTARSVQDILEKDNSGSFDDGTDSLEAIRDHLDGTTILGGIQLDHLVKTASAGTNYPTEMTTDSILAMIMSSDGDPSGYNKTTDSLEAIRDHLDGTTALAGIALDNLIITSDGNQAYPASIADHSILSAIMTSDGDHTGFDRATDSLEAIRDHVEGTTALSGINLDHLVKTVAPGTNYPTNVTTDSILAMIMSDNGNVDGYDKTTHSLEAIGDDTDAIIVDIATAQTELDKIGTIVNAGGTATIGGVFGDFANSSLVTRLGLIQTDVDSIGTISNAGGTAELGAALGPFANSTLVARLDILTTNQLYVEKCVEKVATSTDDDLFDVVGEVLITSLVGIVTTTAIGSVQNEISITLDATDTLDHTFSTSVETNGDAVGTRYVFSAANPAVLTPLANGSVGSGNPMDPWVCRAGVIEQVKGAGAGTTGQINWYITYQPLSSDGAVTAAA